MYLGGPGFTPYLTVPDAERAFGVLALKGVERRRPEWALAMAGAGRGRRLPPAALGEHARLVTHWCDAHLAAMAGGRNWLAHLVGEHANRALLGQLQAEHLPVVRWQAPAATYLAWLGFARLSFATARTILEDAVRRMASAL